jgi:predicted CoA-substrate-specific enzyme activase
MVHVQSLPPGVPGATGQRGLRQLRIGIDLGAAQVKAALRDDDGAWLWRGRAANRGHPLAALADTLAALPGQWCAHPMQVAITGSGQYVLDGMPECLRVSEVLAIARAVRRGFPLARTVIDLGGQSSKWILLGCAGQDAVVDFSANGLCAAGAGAFLEQQASRLGLGVEDLGRMAAAARKGATIAGRCSVFAKSDMIHLQQKGTPLEEIAYGLCQALARTFLATVVQGRFVEAPVVLVGGGVANLGLVRAFREHLKLSGDELLAPEDGAMLGAEGAAEMAGEAPAVEFSRFVAAVRERADQAADNLAAASLPSLAPYSMECRADAVEDLPPNGGRVDAYLGLDVGSVSTNLVLLARDSRILEGVYLPTRGRPSEALHEGLSQIWRRYGAQLRILGVGATGSGRHLAAKAVGADVTHNEITAQMISALLFCPEVDTIFEIGGQDSKYISVRDGQLADFEMNKICAGGTGSFLEEQAERLGIQIVGEFSDLALHAARPCDLGARCTVFMDTELVRAQERGAPVEDICAGLAYSVARNYLEKVVAGRPIGRHILFQGGTASNRAVVAAFRQLLGRPVQVHPYNRVSGAIGAALLAMRAALPETSFRGFECCAASSLRSFECQRCENRCQVNRIRLGARYVHFGDVCERYSERDSEPKTVRRPFPELFAARERLLEDFLKNAPGPAERPRLGLLRASLNLEFLPFWATFVRELGYAPVVSGPTTATLLYRNLSGLPAEVCLPIKAAAAQARALLEAGAEKLFVPALLECPARAEDDASHTCFYTQQLPDMLRIAFPNRIIPAQFAMRDGILGLVEPVLSLAQALERPMEAVGRALVRARAAQARFVEARTRLGREALAAPCDRAVVVLGRPYNTHDPFLNLGLGHHLEQLGLPAIPWDFLPLQEVQLEARWQTVPWHYNREHLRALELVRRDGRLFPILVSNYGCGPDAFGVKHLEEMLAGTPRLLLEFDEHRGEAGLVTRLEAFADEIAEHLRVHSAVRSGPVVTPGPRPVPSGRRFLIPHFSEHARIYAAVLRSVGYTAEVLPEPDGRTVRLGEQYASGRECHPYTILAGELLRLVLDSPPGSDDVFLVPSCASPCLLRQYGDALRILVRRHRLPQMEIWDAAPAQLSRLIGANGLLRLYEGLLATDILFTLSTRLEPYEQAAGAFQALRTKVLDRLTEGVAERLDTSEILAECAQRLWAAPRIGRPGMRPVVGVTGDLYTRMNPVGNAGLFHRLQQLGCEVWPSPFFANSTLASSLETRKQARQVRLLGAMREQVAKVLTTGAERRMVGCLPPEVAAVAAEPPAEELIRLAQPYLGPESHFLIVLAVGKIADFLHRGAAGVISAAGINCIVGTVASSMIPALRADFADAPVLSMAYGGTEGPGQRIRLETFVHQVHERWRRRAA